MRVEMLDDYQREAGPLWQRADEFLERSQATGGRADADDRKRIIVAFAHVSDYRPQDTCPRVGDSDLFYGQSHRAASPLSDHPKIGAHAARSRRAAPPVALRGGIGGAHLQLTDRLAPPAIRSEQLVESSCSLPCCRNRVLSVVPARFFAIALHRCAAYSFTCERQARKVEPEVRDEPDARVLRPTVRRVQRPVKRRSREALSAGAIVLPLQPSNDRG